MSDLSISNRYALALIGAEEKKQVDKISADIELIYKTLKSSKELIKVLESPVIKSEKKYAILSDIFEKKVNPDTMNFMKFIIKKNRENLLIKIVKQYLEIRDERFGIISAEIVSSVELTSEQKKKLTDKLENYTKKKVNVSFSLDKKIIGGFVIRMGDTIIDASLKHQLELLKENFLKGDSSLN